MGAGKGVCSRGDSSEEDQKLLLPLLVLVRPPSELLSLLPLVGAGDSRENAGVDAEVTIRTVPEFPLAPPTIFFNRAIISLSEIVAVRVVVDVVLGVACDM